jgi:hypothetical protein
MTARSKPAFANLALPHLLAPLHHHAFGLRGIYQGQMLLFLVLKHNMQYMLLNLLSLLAKKLASQSGQLYPLGLLCQIKATVLPSLPSSTSLTQCGRKNLWACLLPGDAT